MPCFLSSSGELKPFRKSSGYISRTSEYSYTTQRILSLFNPSKPWRYTRGTFYWWSVIVWRTSWCVNLYHIPQNLGADDLFVSRMSGVWPLGHHSSGRFVRSGPGSAPLLTGAQQTGPAGFKAELERQFTEPRWSKWQVLALCCSFLLRAKILTNYEASPLATTFFFFIHLPLVFIFKHVVGHCIGIGLWKQQSYQYWLVKGSSVIL